MKPTKKQETGMALAVIIVILSLLFLCSCSTKKSVTEYIYVHDTLTVSHSDTVWEIRVQKDTVVDWKIVATHDTIHHEKEKVIVLNEQGDTISQREWDRLWQKIHELEQSQHNESHNDSSAYYKAENDSLRKVIDSQRDKTTVKVLEKTSWKEKITFLLLMVALAIWLWKSKKI